MTEHGEDTAQAEPIISEIHFFPEMQTRKHIHIFHFTI